MTPPILSHRWILAFGLTLAVAVQLALVQDTWYLDADDWFIVDMGRQVAAAPALDHFTRFWTEEPTWRPVLTARTAVEYALFGPQARPRVLVNLALHVLSALLLFLTARAWLGRPRAAAWAAVLYAVHPLHAEALTWFHSGFEGITPTVPILLALWLFVSRRPLPLTLAACQLAFFTREHAAALAVLITLAAVARAPSGRRLHRAVADSLPYWALLAANVAARAALLAVAEHDPTGSFHLVDSPFVATLTTFAHPWIPIHPALPLRVVWWAVFAAVPLALVWVQRGLDTRELKTAFLVFTICALPFIPAFHESHRFVEALPGGYEQRWYFFHLPLAALMVWPAYVIIERDYRATGWSTVALAALTGLLLTAQAFNARWYAALSTTPRTVAHTVDGALASGAPAVGVVIHAGLDGGELADQVFLNLSRIWPDHRARAFHLYREPGEPPALEEAVTTPTGARDWRPVRALPPSTRWWIYDDATDSMTPIPAPELP